MNEKELRALAVSHTLFRETTLARAVARLGFVQADPIRSPATAQDLVLRHRVRGYRQGDLERAYAELLLEEDYLYAYGSATRAPRYYAMPMLFRDRVIGWANVSHRRASAGTDEGEVEVGFASGRPRDRAFAAAVEEEIVRIRTF